ncbi:MAG TPA: S1 family peptidase [Propionicimonas sp.]|nr:S1 family peptidase [Propionicimonas sp.]
MEELTTTRVHSRTNDKTSVFSDAQLTDLATAAKSTGTSLSTLKQIHRGVDAFMKLVALVRASNPGVFVQAGLGSAEDPTPWIVFTDHPGDAVQRQLEQLPTDVDVLVGAPANESELDLQVEALVAALGAQDGIQSASAGVVEKGLTIKVSYTREQPQNGGGIPAESMTITHQALNAVAGKFADGELPVTVQFQESSDPISTSEAIRGGRDLNRADDNVAECTAGFAVDRNGERGILTAQHCRTGLRYQSSLGVIQYVTAARNSKSGRTDLQFHRKLPDISITKQFRATGTASSDDRTVDAAVNPVVGQTACHWGRTTGYSCSTIESTNFCVDYANWEVACNLDSTVTQIDQPGDSGGPWFLGTTAIGIHSGGGAGMSLFTRIGAATDFLDATVQQQ